MGIILDDCCPCDNIVDIASADAPSSQFVRVSKCDAVFPGADPFLNPVPVHGQILRNRSLAHKHAVKPMITSIARSGGQRHRPLLRRMQIDGFIDKVEFKKTDRRLDLSFRNTKPAPGTNGPLIPGDPEREAEAIRSKKGFRCSNRWWMTCWISRRRPECRSRQNRDCPSAAQAQPTKKRNFTAETRSSQSSESILIQFFFTQRPPRLCGESSKSLQNSLPIDTLAGSAILLRAEKKLLKFPIQGRRCVKQRRQRVRVSCGPGTPMGELFRRFWLPAMLPDELPEADCPPVRLRLLGEDLVAFRDSNGEIGVVEAHCPTVAPPSTSGATKSAAFAASTMAGI